MGTVETGLAISDYADYMIASEETESGYGWYYTNWLKALSDNTSISTVDLGKKIVDDFISASSQAGQGWAGTQSVVDLAELSYTVPDKLKAFATSTTALIESDSSSGDYKNVSQARGKARSFGEAVNVDQVDLVDFAERLGTKEGAELAKAVRGAVKYNNTTRDMTNSYGLSIYFPYTNSAYVKNVESIYNKIGIASEYTRCIQTYAAMGLSGQYISGGTGNPFNSLYGLFGSGDYGDSEIAAAIIHAVEMQRIAKRKVKHLEQEEYSEQKNNTNTGNHLVTLGTTKHKTKSVYYANGQEITKEEYESVVKSNHNDTLIFNVKIENLISID